MFSAVICAEKLGFGGGAPGRGYFRQKLEYSMRFSIVGIKQGSRITLAVCSLDARSLSLLPSSICAAFLFAPVLAFRLLLFHFVPPVYLQAVSAWFSLLCTETVVQKLYFYIALLLMVVHPTSKAGPTCAELWRGVFSFLQVPVSFITHIWTDKTVASFLTIS